LNLDLDLPCVPDSVGRARDAVGQLEAELSDRRLGDVRLLVSEVVTNAVRHAGLTSDDVIRLRFLTGDGQLRVEVTDPGSGFEPRKRDPDLNRPGGWGLYLVEQLAERWGVETSGRTLVWFELPLG
jgi:anti-sigma regulatory factor (Ser/Thr protein kinase)